MSWLTSMVIAGVVSALAVLNAGAGTLQDVQGRGDLNCGVSTNLARFAQKEPDGRWTGLDVVTCRAVAAVTLGDAEKFAYSGLTSKARYTALQPGAVDLLSRSTTWTISRDTALEANFASANFYEVKWRQV